VRAMAACELPQGIGQEEGSADGRVRKLGDDPEGTPTSVVPETDQRPAGGSSTARHCPVESKGWTAYG
jgi:hypothetical protein